MTKTRKKRGAAKAVGLGKKKEDNGDKGAAFCCPGMSLKARYMCFALFWVLGLVFFAIADYMIYPSEPGKDPKHRGKYPTFCILGWILIIGSVGFLAGLCRQIRVVLRYFRITSVLVMVACILINVLGLFPLCIDRKPGRRSLADGPVEAPLTPQPGSGAADPAGAPPTPQPGSGATDPAGDQPVPPADTSNGEEKKDPPAKADDTSDKPNQGSPQDKSNPDPLSNWKSAWAGADIWVLAMLLQILQLITWFWYSITYMPCMRKCVHCCCKKSKDKDKGKA